MYFPYEAALKKKLLPYEAFSNTEKHNNFTSEELLAANLSRKPAAFVRPCLVLSLFLAHPKISERFISIKTNVFLQIQQLKGIQPPEHQNWAEVHNWTSSNLNEEHVPPSHFTLLRAFALTECRDHTTPSLMALQGLKDVQPEKASLAPCPLKSTGFPWVSPEWDRCNKPRWPFERVKDKHRDFRGRGVGLVGAVCHSMKTLALYQTHLNTQTSHVG